MAYVRYRSSKNMFFLQTTQKVMVMISIFDSNNMHMVGFSYLSFMSAVETSVFCFWWSSSSFQWTWQAAHIYQWVSPVQRNSPTAVFTLVFGLNGSCFTAEAYFNYAFVNCRLGVLACWKYPQMSLSMGKCLFVVQSICCTCNCKNSDNWSPLPWFWV
jgi:hypothetical protein